MYNNDNNNKNITKKGMGTYGYITITCDNSSKNYKENYYHPKKYINKDGVTYVYMHAE